MLKLQRKQVTALFLELGFEEKTVTGWTNARMTAKVQALPGTVDGDEEVKALAEKLDDKNAKLLKDIRKAVKAEDDVSIQGGVEPAKSAPNKVKTTASKNGKEGGKKKERAGTDRFGSRLGTNRAKLNAQITHKPKSVRELTNEAGLTITLDKHCKALAAAGKIKRNDEGKYYLPK